MDGRQCGDREVALVNITIDELELILYPREHFIERRGGIRAAALELEIGDQPSEPEHRRRRSGLRVGGGRASCSAPTEEATEPG